MELNELLIFSAVVVWVFMSLAYLFSLYIKNASFVDIAWGVGFMVITLAIQQAVGPDLTLASLIVWSLVMLWGVRLSMHIATRFDPKVEDWRYSAMRESWGDKFWWQSYFKIFMLQGLLMLVVALPIITSVFADDIASWQIVLGAGVWSVGFIFETIGDWQLRRFKSHNKNKGKIMTSGLWKYTRHPNYFGEVTQWWGLYIIVFGSSYCLLSILSPLLITVLILKVSGVPLLEKRWEGNKAWEKYKAKTSRFFPLPQKSAK